MYLYLGSHGSDLVVFRPAKGSVQAAKQKYLARPRFRCISTMMIAGEHACWRSEETTKCIFGESLLEGAGK